MSKKNLKLRVDYRGGKAEDRMVEDKLYSLKQALKYSYQSATAILPDGREFKCLINPDKLKPEYDNKILSIPYENTCLNTDDLNISQFSNIERINLLSGDVFTWKETNTEWIVYLQYLEEKAYFRAEIRRCDDTAEIVINNRIYKVFIRGPVETKIPWNQKKKKVWNDINYTLSMYITKNQDTLDFFHRFQIVKIHNQSWEVQAVNSYDADNVIEVFLKEAFNNTMEDIRKKEKEESQNQKPINPLNPHIEGPIVVYPFDTITYKIKNPQKGKWVLSNQLAVIKTVNEKDNSVEIEIVTGKSGTFTIQYVTKDQTIESHIKIESL